MDDTAPDLTPDGAARQLILRTLMFGNAVAGYPSLMAVILFLGGTQLITLGIIGEYLGRVFNETKRRPLYLVERYAPAPVGPPAGAGDALAMTGEGAAQVAG